MPITEKEERNPAKDRLAHFVGSDAHGINYCCPKYGSGIRYIEEHCGREYLESLCYRNADSITN